MTTLSNRGDARDTTGGVCVCVSHSAMSESL